MLRERFRIPFQSGFRWWELIAKRVDIALFMVVAQMTHLAAFQDERAAIKKHGEPCNRPCFGSAEQSRKEAG